ncbi:site-specific DNA-methyltransferase [Methylomonas lenta]|nr:site-specific DNA-methyltransferase [Methylomonas lenta]
MTFTTDNLEALEKLDKDDLVKMLKTMMSGGVVLNFHGKRTAQEIDKKVRPRQTQIIKKLCVGTQEDQARNMIIEGENLQAMVTLYKERGQVDLILTDPPYNTGQYFRYNDRWDNDPNDPELGQVVKLEDGSRHTKWMKAMLPRLNMMKAMLKPNGVLAICIDDNELFHLGMMLDEIFGEENRIAIINWQKSYAPKNDSKHVSTATEYVLVYAKDKSLAKTGLEERTDGMNKKYRNLDEDPDGAWRSSDATVSTPSAKDRYAIQSPFTGELHYPGSRAWTFPKKSIKYLLEQWGSDFVEVDLNDGRPKALLLKGSLIPKTIQRAALDNNPVVSDQKIMSSPVIAAAKSEAEKVLKKGTWPQLYFGDLGTGRPAVKRYLNQVKKGKVPLTYWAADEYDEILEIGSQSWDHEESGHSQSGINELNSIVGKGHGFDTVKPLKLFKKIIHLWCPSNGLVLDPYAGSGTTGHAVLELNYEAETNRRFILVEQGSPERGDKYARSLTQERLKRVITGERPNNKKNSPVMANPLGNGFQFRMLTKKIDSKTVLTMRKDELIDVVITSHWENGKRGGSCLIRVEEHGYKYLVGKNEQNEGYFLIWNGGEQVGQLDTETYATVIQEGKKAGLKQPFHVYARYEIYQSKNVIFYKIPDKILAHLGLNENNDSFNEEGDE